MQFQLVESKIANKFFFISNLSEWHFSCRPKYNKKWLEITGMLSLEEKEALNDFKNIMKKYGFIYKEKKNQYLGQVFLKSKNEKIAKQKLKDFVSEKEYQIINNIFLKLQKRFDKIWNLFYKKDDRIKIFNSIIKEKRASLLLKNLEKIFFRKTVQKPVKVVILYNPLEEDETAAGSANLDNIHITLELPKLERNTWQLDFSFGILAHEAAHIMLRESDLEKIINETQKKLKLPQVILNFPIKTGSLISEAIIGSFVPIGYSGQKYSNFSLSPLLLGNIDRAYKAAELIKNRKEIDCLADIERYLIWHLYPLAVIYSRDKKKIDQQFINIAGLTLKNLLTN